MIITIENNIISLIVHFAGVTCELNDDSLQCIEKIKHFSMTYSNAQMSYCELIIDTYKGTTQYYLKRDDAFPLFNVRTSLLFDTDCSLVRLINLFASKRATMKIKDGMVVK